ncbi:SigE family RNA polymerase sigma factor [Nocardioides sp. CBS4Y-1]|uniref:SigE family RNA polymerase sigma factor n=1 Tax=Nocardioides acrostichi TaxID=2784339 RepID=A0A930YC83_9ACTN|nr:SigE family RNA polymerase sigma factor [Nocardioides acrostichi]
MAAREASFESFVRARTTALGRTAYLLTGDAHAAEDLVQSALLRAAEHWRRIETSPEAYVRRTMYHLQVSAWRKRGEVREHDLGGFDAASPVCDTDLRLSIADALAGLTVKQRTVLVLRFFEDLTESQTADALGISRGTVKSTTRQALDRLRVLAPHLAELVEERP